MSKQIICLFTLFLLSMTTIPACKSALPSPTPKLKPNTTVKVVEFATEKPSTPIPTPTKRPRLITPTATATVIGQVVSQTVETSAADLSNLFNRPPDQNPLTGLKVITPTMLQRRPLMVRVGNDPVARPQIGLDKADMVYEELVEWWITRFTAIYLTNDPPIIGPIRSARLLNVQLTPQYQGALAHSGASDPVRWELSQIQIVNLDEFFTPQPFIYRKNEGWQTRLGFNALVARDYMAAEGLEKAVKLRGFVFSDKLDLNFDSAVEIIIPYPSQTCEAKWLYDSQKGQYLRFMGGEIFNTAEGQQIKSDNVIIYFADHQRTTIVEDVTGATSVRIIANGRGQAWLLRDGKILKGNWETNGYETPLFTFDNGQPMPLKPGNSWVELVPLDYLITLDGKQFGLQETPAETPEKISAPTPIGFHPTPTLR